MKKLYKYEGRVKSFNNTLCDKYIAETMAETASKAISNLAYRYKKEAGLALTARISLPDKIKEVI